MADNTNKTGNALIKGMLEKLDMEEERIRERRQRVASLDAARRILLEKADRMDFDLDSDPTVTEEARESRMTFADELRIIAERLVIDYAAKFDAKDVNA